MIDVDIPDPAPRTWRGFLIQIATIVIGLLIAVGIEKAVTRIDQLGDIAEARAVLQREERLNVRIAKVLMEEWRRVTPQLATNLAVFAYLADNPEAKTADLPGKVAWEALRATYLTSAWKTVQAGPVLALMPPREVRRYSELYGRLAGAEESVLDFSTALGKARRYTIREPDPTKLDRAQVARQVDLTTEVIYFHAARGRVLNALQRRFPAFEGPANEEIVALFNSAGDAAARTEVRSVFDRIQRIKDEAE